MATKVAGELYYELDGQLLEIKRQLRQLNGYPFDPNLLKVALQSAIEGIFGDANAPEVISAKPIPSFSIIATTHLDALDEKKTAECFPKPRYAYRDNNFDNWLPAYQPKTDKCTIIATLEFNQNWSFVEAARALPDAPKTNDAVVLGNWLIERGYIMTATQSEEMVDKTENGVETKMRTDGYGNFFFVETGNPDNPVSVGHVHRGGRGWGADVIRLGNDGRWYAVGRLLVRNLKDASKL